MTSSRKKSGVAFWATVGLVVVLVGYPLSIGPFVWLHSHGYLSLNSANIVARSFYRPIAWIYRQGPQPVSDVIEWYRDLWVP